MKHFVLLLILAIMPTIIMGQQKLIESHIMPNRKKGEAIMITNQIQVVTQRQIENYCTRHNYILGKYTKINDCMTSFVILPANEKEAYIQNKISPRKKGQPYTIYNGEQILTTEDYKNHGFLVLNKQGTKFEILPKDEVEMYIYNKLNSSKWGYNMLTATGKGETFVFGKLDFKWSGNVTNGMINGSGSGFAKISGKEYCFVHADFVNGLPKGDVSFVRYYYNNNYDLTAGNKSIYRVSDCSEDIAYLKAPGDGDWGLVTETGKIVVRNKFYDVVEPFKDGHGVVMMHYGTTDSETTCPDCSGRGAISGCSNCGGDGYTGWSNDTKCSTCNGTGAHGCSKCHGKGKVHQPGTPIIKDIVIDKNGEFVDWGPNEKAKLAEQENAERARQQRIKDSLARVEQLRLEAERKKAELERKVAINCNPKLWTQGDHICYSLPNYSGKITCGTLEEWNPNHTKAKIKVVTSPSKNATYNGEQLFKNNTFWIDTKGTKWHKAVEGEFEASLEYDNSVKGPDVIYQTTTSSSSSPIRYDDCPTCKGTGRITCYSCGGDGYSGWSNDEFCTSCNGSGYRKCYDCNGLGRK